MRCQCVRHHTTHLINLFLDVAVSRVECQRPLKAVNGIPCPIKGLQGQSGTVVALWPGRLQRNCHLQPDAETAEATGITRHTTPQAVSSDWGATATSTTAAGGGGGGGRGGLVVVKPYLCVLQS